MSNEAPAAAPVGLPAPVARAPVEKLTTDLLAVVENHNPSYGDIFNALASLVVGLSMQYVHAGLGVITPENMSEQLTRFQGLVAELGVVKMQRVNEQLENLHRLELQAEEMKKRLPDNSQVQE